MLTGRLRLLLLLAATGLLRGQPDTATPAAYDVVVFGATPAGVTAAVAASRGGARVVLVEPGSLVGGMMAGGLQKTDLGRPETIGGLAREFFDRVRAHYTQAYGPESPQVKACHGGYYFEPKVAQQVFRALLAEASVTTYTKERLESAEATPERLTAFTTRQAETGERTRFTAGIFIDATYEGDLLARAGVPYRIGREARAEHGEPLAGVTAGPPGLIGTGDHRVQSYNLRGTLCRDPANRVPIPRPREYFRDAHAALIRTVNTHRLTRFEELFPDLPRWAEINGKLDPNKADLPGAQDGWIEGDYEQRARITARLQDYWLSLWYLLQNDPELPEAFRADARRYGLPRDEYAESGHVSPQVYVREGRRLLGRYLLTQRDVQHDRTKPDGVCLGSYNLDAHPVQLIRTPEGLQPEGDFNGATDPYEIPYRCLTPVRMGNLLVVAAVSATHVAYASLRMEPVFMMLGHAGGVAASLAWQARGTVQDVPVAALRAKLAADRIPLQAPYRPWVEIRAVTPPPYRPGETIEFAVVERDVRGPLAQLAWNFDGSGEVQAEGPKVRRVFTQPGTRTVRLLARQDDRLGALPAELELDLGPGEILDREVTYAAANLTGRWIRARGPEIEYRSRVGLVDEGRRDGRSRAEFTTVPARTGRYQVAVAYGPAGNRATNTPVTITHAAGTATVTLNQRRKATPFAFTPLGEFRFEAGRPATVTFTNEGVDGLIMIDTVRWIWAGP